jgi:hypothetical protein
MCRMRRDLNPLTDPVLSHVTDKQLHYDNNNQLKSEILRLKQIITDVLIPFEVKITKSKESGKDFTRFSLFCTENLRIYNNIQEYIDDAKTLYTSSKRLENDIKSLTDLAITSVTEEFDQIPGSFPDVKEITADIMDKPDFLS